MIDSIHPSLFFILGAVLIPFLRGSVLKGYLLLIPAIAIAAVMLMPEGVYWRYNFLGNELIFGKVDKLSLVFAYAFTIMAFIGMVYALHVEDKGEHVAAWLYAGGSLGVILAGDYFTLFIFWELMAFASAYLIFARREKRSVEAGYRYILMHIFGGVCLMGGIVLHYASTGNILFGPIAHDGSAAFYLILAGFIINAAVPPLHTWLTDAYPEATITGAIFMSAFTTKTAVYVLIRVFPGTEILIWVGTIMAIYGVVYATMQDDMRKLLAYHIVSQIGYMVAGIGMGTELALNGSAALAITNILYKGVLFMGAGAVIYMTGKRRLSELGGLYKTMPVTMILYMIGGFSISAVPLFAGFVSKSMIIAAANHDRMAIISLLLTMVSSGTFLSTTLKIPYFMFFGKDSGVEAKEPPLNMLIGMGIASLLCIAIGVFPGAFYSLLPYPVHFEPYTGDHVTGSLGILMFTALAFFLLLKKVKPEPALTLDMDWFYRKGCAFFMRVADMAIAGADNRVGEGYNTVILSPAKRTARYCSLFDLGVIDSIVNGAAWLTRLFAWLSHKFDIYIVDGLVNSISTLVSYNSGFWRRIQTGYLQNYALVLVAGILMIIAKILIG